MTRLAGFIALNHWHAEPTLNTIKSLLENAGPTNPNLHKMSAFRADGASVNIGATRGMGALFRCEIGEHALSYLCLSH